MEQSEKTSRFETVIWPHMGAAYNLARWLMRRPADAEDIVQDALLKAFKAFDNFRGEEARAWLLTIVRNTCYTALRQSRHKEVLSDSDMDWSDLKDGSPTPEAQALTSADHAQLGAMLAGLPLEFREILVLRELEGLSYKEIGDVAGLPIGTVMSRLARARDRLQVMTRKPRRGEIHREL